MTFRVQGPDCGLPRMTEWPALRGGRGRDEDRGVSGSTGALLAWCEVSSV